MNKINMVFLFAFLPMLYACGGPDNNSNGIPFNTSVALTADEAAGLTYMREEEELARDLYMGIFNNKGLIVFDNISTKSETKHALKMLDGLNAFGLPDSSTGQPDTYNNTELQALYDQLILGATGATSDNLAAYKIGALVEEVDILDINGHKALVQSEHTGIIAAYDNLLCGSRNHLRAFAEQISIITLQPYVIQVPELAAEVQAILSTAKEKCM